MTDKFHFIYNIFFNSHPSFGTIQSQLQIALFNKSKNTIGQNTCTSLSSQQNGCL